MSETVPTGRTEPADIPWSQDPEVPDADAEEQRREVVEDPEELDPETIAGRDPSARFGEPPLEVGEFDLADQSVEVPLDDDDLDRG